MNSEIKSLLKEFLTDEQKNMNDAQFKDVFQHAVNGNYENFVTQLKHWAVDPKVMGFLKSGFHDGMAADDKFSVSNGTISCAHLIPTQNEIDLHKSLDFPLKRPELIKKYLTEKNIEILTPIITFNGRYIIDGHHRWSQVYCINPNATMKVINFKKAGIDAEEMLKTMQIAIAATTGNIPVSTVEGINLLNVPAKQIMEYIVKNISEEGAKLLGNSKAQAAKRIALNCQRMQKNNRPIPGAPERGFMPQTDEPKGNISNIISALTSGKLQVVPPYIKHQASVPIAQESKWVSNETLSVKKAKENKNELKEKIIAKLFLSGLKEVKDKSIESFIDVEYEDLDTLIDDLEPEDLRHKFVVFLNKDQQKEKDNPKDINEAISSVLTEMIKLGTVSEQSIVPKEIVKIAQKFYEELKGEKYTVTTQGYYWQNFTGNKQSGPAIGFAIGSDITIIKMLSTGKILKYSDELLYNVVKRGRLEKPLLITGENLNESKQLKEAEDEVETADPVAMFQDFSDISGSLADIYSTLMGYKNSYVSNPKIQQAISVIMNDVNDLMKKSTSTMQMLNSSFGLNETININNVEKWTPEDWKEFENLSPMEKMNLASASDYFKKSKTPQKISKVINQIKSWAKYNYKGWEKVATTEMGRRSIVRQYLTTTQNIATEKISGIIDTIVKYWK